MARPEAAVTLRALASAEDYAACVELQRATWGRSFVEVVPQSILKIGQQVGGVSAGAFDAQGKLLGFVFGLTGVRDGHLAHWSHMLAVDAAARDAGIGNLLKRFQRDLLLPLGVVAVHWTYDPLEARNAHLNLNRLGAEVAEYVPDMYAGEEGSDLWTAIGTDRLILDWRIASERVVRALAGEPPPHAEFLAAPIAGNPAGDPQASLAELPLAPRVRIEIPASIQDLKAEGPEGLEAAAAWRATTRQAFQTYLGHGYRVASFYREITGRDPNGRCFYGLARP